MKAVQDETRSAVPRLGPRTDHDLMRTSLHRPELFAEIFDRHAPALHRYLSRRVGDPADDLLSETFLTAFRKRGDYREDRLDVRPWLVGIGANLIRRHHLEQVARLGALSRSSSSLGASGSVAADDFEAPSTGDRPLAPAPGAAPLRDDVRRRARAELLGDGAGDRRRTASLRRRFALRLVAAAAAGAVFAGPALLGARQLRRHRAHARRPVVVPAHAGHGAGRAGRARLRDGPSLRVGPGAQVVEVAEGVTYTP